MRNRITVRFIYALLVISLPALYSCSKSSSDTAEPECGIERWHVKNLLDIDAPLVSTMPMATSIAAQDSFARDSVNENTRRLDFEKETVSIPCTIVQFKKEDDNDIHLILVDDQLDSMIAEVPSTDCAEVAASSHASDFAAAGLWVRQNLGNPTSNFKNADQKVTVTGVLFQDFPHGQKGHATNYREVHPVLRIQ